jgi:hypothetical protein
VGAGATAITNLDIDGATDITADLATGDLFIVDDGAGGTNKKTTVDRIATYVSANLTDGGVLNADIGDDQIDSEHYVDASIDFAHIAADVITGATNLASGVAHDDELLVSDDGTLKKMDVGLIAALAAGTGLTATNGELAVDAAQTQITSVGTIGTGTWEGTAIAQTYIAANAIVTGKIADGTIATVDLADNSITGAKIAIGSDAEGDIMYYNGTDYVRLAKGTDGEVLKLASGVPSWDVDAIAARPEAPPTPTSSSDRRFKKNISTVSGALEKLSKLNPVNYDWRQDEFKNKGFNDKKQWGFIAQEVEKVMPELVGADEDDYLTLNYTGFVPLLTKAMQEQQTEIENQQKEIDELKAQLEMIMKMMQSDMSDKTDNKKAENNEKPVKLSMATVK